MNRDMRECGGQKYCVSVWVEDFVGGIHSCFVESCNESTAKVCLRGLLSSLIRYPTQKMMPSV